MDARVKPAHDKLGHARAIIPPRHAPELCKSPAPKKSEGAGNAGRPMAPAVRVQEMHTVDHRYPGTPGVSCAMVLTVSFVLLCPQNLPECANGRFSPTARR